MPLPCEHLGMKFLPSVVCLKFVEKMQKMVATRIEFNSPFFKGGIFSLASQPLFGKEGKGKFSGEMTTNLYSELWFQDTSF